MAATFRPVNPPVTGEEDQEPMETEPTVPPALCPDAATQPQTTVVDDATTPTRATFNSALAAQKPLPTTPFPGTVHIVEPVEGKIQRGNSQRSQTSTQSGDVDMEESEGPPDAADEAPGSDDESLNTDGSKPTKKKKSQRFYCTDYPPCTLSFTRSEHLARHIRKHTGERPFQCHCSRRFSRLDNLRQHAQTVHVNEDIPIDSLAATGARFQRQAMRTDRTRQVGGRARASTASSVGGIARGHAKSLSTSSISSLSSSISTRDRPPPLVMADPRSKGPMEPYSSRDSVYQPYRPTSPSDFSTPTSATFSTGQNSPRWGSGFASPTSSHSRAHSLYTESRTPGRRLSGPSGNNPFQSPYGANVGRPSFSPGAVNTSNPGAFQPAAPGLAPSPNPVGSVLSYREPAANAQDEAWRRRTWHPDSQNFHPARLGSISTPGQYQPIHTPPLLATPTSQAPTIRLPGIESFDSAPGRPLSPPKRIPSPMVIDTEMATPHTLLPGPSSGREGRRNVAQWDMSLHRGLTRLEITSNSSQPRDSAGTWASEANQAVQAQAEQVRLGHPTVRFEADTPPVSNESTPTGSRSLHQHTMSAPSISTPREFKRHGWYHGPMASQGIAQSSRGNRIDRIVHPNLANGFQAFPPRDPPPTRNQPEPQRDNNTSQPMRALDALVAVATSEGSTATAY